MTKPRYWNVWWTLTVVSAALTMIVLVLEALDVFRDLGLILGAGGLLLTILFGFAASTRSSLAEFRGDVLPRFDRLEGGLDTMTGRFDLMTGRLDLMTGQLDLMTGQLDRIISLLDERLPRPAL